MQRGTSIPPAQRLNPGPELGIQSGSPAGAEPVSKRKSTETAPGTDLEARKPEASSGFREGDFTFSRNAEGEEWPGAGMGRVTLRGLRLPRGKLRDPRLRLPYALTGRENTDVVLRDLRALRAVQTHASLLLVR